MTSSACFDSQDVEKTAARFAESFVREERYAFRRSSIP